jgi:hypothetical protein
LKTSFHDIHIFYLPFYQYFRVNEMQVLTPQIQGGLNIYINKKLVASRHNNITASFIVSLIKSITGTSSTSSNSYSWYYFAPSTATVKLQYQNTPVTTAVMSHLSFTDETISGCEHTRIIYSFTDASRTKYSFNFLQLWTASRHALLSHISDAELNTPLQKNPQDVVQIDWWVEMVSCQPFAKMLSYLQQLQSTQCPFSCYISSSNTNMICSFSVLNAFFTLFAVPNVKNVIKDIKTPLTNYLLSGLSEASTLQPQGITAVACYDICSCGSGTSSTGLCDCNISTSQVSGFLSEYIGENYVHVAYNFDNPCPLGQYVIPITTIKINESQSLQFAITAVPSPGTGQSALVFKVPYGKITLNNLFTNQGE